MPTIEEIIEENNTDKTEVDIQNELDYFAKSIYKEFKDNLIKINIESRINNGLGALVVDLNKSTTVDLDIAYYKIEDMTVDMIKVIDMLERSELDLVINIPTNMYNSDNSSSGYVMRRKSIDSNIPLITNIKCARLFVASLREYKANGIDYKSWDEYIMKN